MARHRLGNRCRCVSSVPAHSSLESHDFPFYCGWTCLKDGVQALQGGSTHARRTSRKRARLSSCPSCWFRSWLCTSRIKSRIEYFIAWDFFICCDPVLLHPKVDTTLPWSTSFMARLCPDVGTLLSWSTPVFEGEYWVVGVNLRLSGSISTMLVTQRFPGGTFMISSTWMYATACCSDC